MYSIFYNAVVISCVSELNTSQRTLHKLEMPIYNTLQVKWT